MLSAYEQFLSTPFVIFDIETTGFDYKKGDEVLEIAAQRVVGKKVIEEFHALIQPKSIVPSAAIAVHGLDNAFLAKNGMPAAQIFPSFRRFIGSTTLVGHNINDFDVPFVNHGLFLHMLPSIDNRTIDTLLLSRKMVKLGSYRLDSVVKHFKVKFTPTHRAMDDVIANREVFWCLMDQIFAEKVEGLGI